MSRFGFLRVPFVLSALMLLAAAVEAGQWQTGEGVISTTSPNYSFYVKVYGETYSGTVFINDDVDLTFYDSAPDTPYMGMTTFYHKHGAIAVSGNWQNVFGKIWVRHPGGEYDSGFVVPFFFVP